MCFSQRDIKIIGQAEPEWEEPNAQGEVADSSGARQSAEGHAASSSSAPADASLPPPLPPPPEHPSPVEEP